MRVGTHSFVSFIVLVVICIVSFVSISLIVIMSLPYTVATMMVSGMRSVWMMHVAHAVRYGECICAAIARSMAQQRAGRQSASGQSHEEPHDAFVRVQVHVAV